MHKRLQELQSESDIAALKSKKLFEKHQLRLQIAEAEESFRASSTCLSLMSLTLEENKNSDIKSWLDQGVEDFDKCFSQLKESSRGVEKNVNQVSRLRSSNQFITKRIYNREFKEEALVSHLREKKRFF